MARKDEDLSFAELMASQGVEPLDARRRRESTAKSRSPAARSQTSPQRANSSKAATQKPAEASSRPERAPSPTPAAETSLKPRIAAAERGRDEARAALSLAVRERDEIRQALERTAAQQRTLAERNRALRSSLDQAARERSERTPLRQVLERRGLRGVDEMRQVLSGLLEQQPEALLDAIEVADASRLAGLLERAVSLMHQPERWQSAREGTSVVVEVAPERCEITAGSDIRAEFQALAHACERARVRVITVVGGSPAYRKQIQTLAATCAPALRLHLVSGTRRRERRRAEADLRKSDLVVIWSATELDHSVSALYTGGETPVVQVPHRGISRMFAFLAAWLRER
ncbi:hypothetical protein [Haliangium ochraceum]|uniref:Uncharacterized protein n=1 Tax=Haliangium ochraceum (strain DSM 14365 / JCM 11303 / SMP-2) TaxID=502025 RepID=D0LG96_HALO1|nr:hypothetical protein [Haliangium ochraceum]ACY18121.1 hypothetical protein Hoch_5644 [Haliangium ochraceum DSM 14365]